MPPSCRAIYGEETGAKSNHLISYLVIQQKHVFAGAVEAGRSLINYGIRPRGSEPERDRLLRRVLFFATSWPTAKTTYVESRVIQSGFVLEFLARCDVARGDECLRSVRQS